MRRKRTRIQYYNGETKREKTGNRVLLPFIIIVVLALVSALVLGLVLDGLVGDSRLSAVVVRDPVDFGGVKDPAKKYASLMSVQGDVVSTKGLNEEQIRDAVRELPDGSAAAFLLYDGAKNLYFDAALIGKTETDMQVKTSVKARKLAEALTDEGRYSIGFFVTGAFDVSDAQKRILAVSKEMALLSELASAGFHEIVIVGLPTDSERLTEVNSYIRQASEICPDIILGVSVETESTVSSGISKLVSATETYADSYYLNLKDVAENKIDKHIEKNAYFLTAYNMRLVLGDGEREALISHAASYGWQNYVIWP